MAILIALLLLAGFITVEVLRYRSKIHTIDKICEHPELSDAKVG